MANKKSRPTKSRINSKSKSSRSGKYPGFFARLGRTNLVIICAFVLLIGGFGAWYVKSSEAAGCTSQSFSVQQPGGYGNTCVKAIQSMLDHFYITPYLKICTSGSGRNCQGYYDGIYGYRTAANVKTFQQRYPAILHDGKVGLQTWTALCNAAGNYNTRDAGDYTRAGCTYLTGPLNPIY
ncbi:MAG TPA: peptidoglycan-binding domain-containing protein [Candidatus Saccharimonadales bacterium]|nr:peptidoglycan-binding domain-containing protein [Candidatus Saccharimonadales bacterium]